MTLVALSAAYGAGGSRVGPALAEKLGVPFLDRAIPFAVSERLEVDLETAERHDFRVGVSKLERVLRGFIGQDVGAPVPITPQLTVDEDFCKATEEVLLAQAATGEGVILGRAAAIVLRDRPGVLRARLDGPSDRRAAQAARLGAIELPEAERRLERLDRAHAEYVKRFYSADIGDPSLYDLVLDSTAIELDTCVELLVTAVRSLRPAS
jgi:cytidylate kinase